MTWTSPCEAEVSHENTEYFSEGAFRGVVDYGASFTPQNAPLWCLNIRRSMHWITSITCFSSCPTNPDLRAQDDHPLHRQHHIDHDVRAVRRRFEHRHLHGAGNLSGPLAGRWPQATL